MDEQDIQDSDSTRKRTHDRPEAAKAIAPEHKAQMIYCLTATWIEIELLINFGITCGLVFQLFR